MSIPHKKSNKSLRLHFFLILSFCLLNDKVYGQTDLNSGFGEIKNSNGGISYSVGIVTGLKLENTEVSVLFGIQQPYDTDINTIESNSIDRINIFPNPVENKLTVWIFSAEVYPVSIQIYNSLGQLVFTELQISDYNNTIDVTMLAPGGYYLNINQLDKTVKKFKFNKL